MARRSADINVMVRAAEKAGRALIRDFGEVEQLQVSRKGPSDFVSTADKKAEKTLFEELHKARPDFSFLMEESGKTDGKDPDKRWIVDPLDGTTNFLHGLPHWAISIGLEKDGEITAGVIYDPIKDEMFWAEKGVGAYMNSRRLRVSGRTRLASAIVATGIPHHGHGDHDQFINELEAVMACTAGVRRWGAAALDIAYIAAGRYDGFWERHLSPWDAAAGFIMVREAGGFITEIDGRCNPVYNKSILATNADLYTSFKKILQNAGKAGS